MNSKWYDVTRQSYDSSYHFWFKISATFTIGFGKKIKSGDEVKKQTGVSSGLLQ